MSKATLKPVISKLREIIIKNIAGKMEKYGFNDAGQLITNKPLSEYDSVIKNNLVSLFKGKNIEGNRKEYIAYIQDSARTFLHILICFKTMEQRGIMGNVVGRLMNAHIYDAIIPDFINVHPMAFSDLVEKFSAEISIMEEKDNYEEDREYYNFIYMLSALTKEMAKEVPLLFKDYEYNLVQPDFEGLKEILFNINKIDEDEYAEDDFLGWIYQYWVDIKDDELKTAKGEKDVSYSNAIYYEILNNLEEEQTQFGEFYTPRWVVKYIVDNTLKPYFEDNKKIETIKLLDPACGAGNFLVYAFDVFYELYKIEHPEWPDNHIIGNILEKNIFGVDIQREPLQITAINLWLKAKSKAKDVRIKNLNLFNMNILKANSLYRWENDQEEVTQLSLFQTDIELTEKKYSAEDIGQYITNQTFKSKILARQFFKNKFDIIVMNPPYLGIRKMNSETSQFLKKEYPKYYNNLFEAFIARAEELLIRKGFIGFVGSDSFLTLDSHDKIRELLLLKFGIIQLIKLGLGVFDGPSVSAVLLIGVKEKKNQNQIVKCLQTSIENREHLDDGCFLSVSQKEFKSIKGYPLIFDFTSNIKKLFKNEIPLDDVVEIKQGMITGNNKKYLRNKWEVPNDLIGITHFPYAKGEGCEKWANNITLCINWENEGREIKNEAKIKYGSETRTVKNQKYFFREGLTYSDVGGKNFSARYLPSGCIFDVKGSCIFTDSVELKYLLGFMNSKFVNYLLYKLNPSPMFQVCDLQRIPYRSPDLKSNQRVSVLVEKAIELKRILLGFQYHSDFFEKIELQYGFDYGAQSVAESYEYFVKYYKDIIDELEDIQFEIDNIVFELYNLESEDIKSIEKEFPISKGAIKVSEIGVLVLKYLSFIIKDYIKRARPKLYTNEEIESIIRNELEKKHRNGFMIVQEIEAILGKNIGQIISSGIKKGSTSIFLYGNGSNDSNEPMLQMRLLSGSGNDKKIVIWYLSHFLLEFEEDKKYVMQNEIRRLSNEVYRPRLQTVKEKLQGSLSSAEKKELEKQEKLLSEAVKTLEVWKVVD